MSPVKAVFAAIALAALAAPVLAADPADPVRELLKAADHNNQPDVSAYEDYFSDDRLGRLYSKGFVAIYRAAWKAQDSDNNSGYLLDADPITAAQDGCPFKNLAIAPPQSENGKSVVEARFQSLYCLGDDYKNTVTTVRFQLVEQDGAFVIDDIQQIEDGKLGYSLKSNLEALAK